MDQNDLPVHVVPGIPSGKESPAVLVTAYRPDPKLWESGFFWKGEEYGKI